MKRRSIKLLSFLITFVLLFSLAACGKKDGKAKDKGKGEVTNQAADVEYQTIGDYVNSKEFQDELAKLRSKVENQDIDLQITAENNILIYASKYNKLSIDDIDAASIEASLDKNASSYSALARGLKESTNESNPVVRIVYLASDGHVILTKDYSIE